MSAPSTNVTSRTVIKSYPPPSELSMAHPHVVISYQHLLSIRNKLSTEDSKPKLELISSGMVPTIIQFMYCKDSKLVYESLWIITNIAASTNECTEYIPNHNAIQGLVHVILNNNFNNDINIISQSAWALSNIAIDNKEFGTMILETNVVNKIINLILSLNINHKQTIQLYNQLLWLINCTLKPQSMKYLNLKKFKEMFCNLLQLICKLLTHSDDSLAIVYSLWCLNYITQRINHTLIEYIINWNDKYFIEFCMKILANGIDKYDDITLQNNPSILSNKTLMNTLINCATNDIKSIRIQAIGCICNLIFRASLKQANILVKYDIIKILSDILNPINMLKDQTIIKVIEGLQNLLTIFSNNEIDIKPFISMFEQCNGRKYLTEMWNHDDNISKRYANKSSINWSINICSISFFINMCSVSCFISVCVSIDLLIFTVSINTLIAWILKWYFHLF